jgi:hypothetical protein
MEKVLTQHKTYVHRRITINLGVNKKRILRVIKLYQLSNLTIHNEHLDL